MKAFSANIYKRSLPRWPSYTCASGNRLAWDASETATNLYAYDGAGRLTNHVVNGQTRTFAYNFQGRMTSLTDIDGSVFAYEFDGEGNRLSQSLNNCLSKRFVYDGTDVLLELNPTNGVAYAWVNGPGIDQPIERLLFIDGEPRARRVFHADALGSVAALTDPAGLPTDTYTYSAFGSLRSSSGPDHNRVTYTAREQLGDSQGWMYYRHRVYTSSLGRFSSVDPLGFVDGPNMFAYVRLSPFHWTDPWGLERDNFAVAGDYWKRGQLAGSADNGSVCHKILGPPQGRQWEKADLKFAPNSQCDEPAAPHIPAADILSIPFTGVASSGSVLGKLGYNLICTVTVECLNYSDPSVSLETFFSPEHLKRMGYLLAGSLLWPFPGHR